MQTTDFIKYISNSDSIQFLSESEVVSVVKEFPYCQSGQVLLALHLNHANHLLFDQQLKKSAIYSSDRKKLFDLISKTKEEVNLKIEEIEINSTTTEIIAETFIEQPEQNLLVDEGEVEPRLNEVEKTENDKQLEKEYLSQAISSSYTIDQEVTTENVKDGQQKQQIALFDENSEFTFSEWLKHLPSRDPKLDEETTTRKNLNLDLIDRFIQEDPKIKPKKTEFYSPVNMARLSVVDDSELVSETLALIHVDQGNYSEAIKTYQKLSLKNPEKRSYFAVQIKILNQKIK